MTIAPSGRACRREGIELLDRALAYTRGALSTVREEDLARATPCRAWRLVDLLTHMDDALDAFGEGARGGVGLRTSLPAQVRIASLQRKACALLGAWSGAVPDVVQVGGVPVDVAVLAHAAALEITVHGWDVARSTASHTPLPDDLAERLLPVARSLVDDRDRPGRFAPALTVPVDAGPETRLMASLGRRT